MFGKLYWLTFNWGRIITKVFSFRAIVYVLVCMLIYIYIYMSYLVHAHFIPYLSLYACMNVYLYIYRASIYILSLNDSNDVLCG